MFKKYKIEIIIFLSALFLRLLFAFFVYQAHDSNSEQFLGTLPKDGYYEIAHNLITDKIFSYNSVEPIFSDSTRMPIYPIIIASSLYIFNSLLPLVIFQIIISSLLPILGRRISLEITHNSVVSDFVTLLLIIEPVGIWLAIIILTETFFTFFFFLFILFILKFIKISQSDNILTPRSFKIIISAAIFLGIATLTRPTTLYFSVILAVSWLIYGYFSKQKLFLKPVVIFLLIFIFTISPWLYRNYKVFGVASISSVKEEVLFCALVPSVLSAESHNSYSESQTIFFKSEGLGGYPVVNLDKASWFRREAIKELKKHPKELVIISGINLLAFFTHDGMLAFLGQLGVMRPAGLTVGKIFKQPWPEFYGTIKGLFFSPAILIFLTRLLWTLITFLFFASIIHKFIKKKFTLSTAFALICIAYFALTTISNGLGVNARFRFPVNIFIFMFAISFLYNMTNIHKDKILSKNQ